MNKIVFLALFVLSACGSLPERQATTHDQSPQLLLRGMPENASIVLDGSVRIPLEEGKNRIPVAPGVHQVVIMVGGQAIYEREVFLEGNTVREIDLN